MVTEGERLREPSCLDALRGVASLIGDVEDSAECVLAPGLFGAFSYEVVDRFESLPPRRPDPLAEPDRSVTTRPRMHPTSTAQP